MDIGSEVPGMSLFQKLDRFQPDPHEMESAEDEKARHEEIHNLLEKAFDGFEVDNEYEDDGESSTNTTRYPDDQRLNDVHTYTHDNENGVINGENVHEGYYVNDYGIRNSEVLPDILYLKQNSESNNDNSVQLEYTTQNQQFLNMGFINGEGTENSSHYNHCFRNESPETDAHERFQTSNKDHYNSKTGFRRPEHLEVMLGVREREVKRLQELMEEMKEASSAERDEMFKKLMLSEAEKERAIALHKEAEGRLFSSRERVEELEKQVANLKVNIENLEKSKSRLSEDLELCRANNTNLQEKNLLLERQNMSSTDKHNAICLSRQKKYEEEIQSLQKENEKIACKLQMKETECEKLLKSISELENDRENLILQKSETVNKLNRALEESQRHCQQLMSSGGQDYNKLKRQFTAVSEAKDELEEKCTSLKTEIETLKAVLTHYKNLTNSNLLSSQVTESLAGLGLNFNVGDLSREDTQKLTASVIMKDKQIKSLKDNEKKYLLQIGKLKEDISNLQSQLKEQDELLSELNKQKKDAANSSEQLKKCQSDMKALQLKLSAATQEKDEICAKCEELRRELDSEKAHSIEKSSEVFLSFHRDQLLKVREECQRESEEKVAKISARLDQTLKELDEVKAQYVEISSAKEKILVQLCKEQDSVQKLTTQMNSERKNYSEIIHELQEEQKLLKNLTENIKKELHDHEKIKSDLAHERLNSEMLQRKIEEFEKQRNDISKKIEDEVEKAKLEAVNHVETEWKKQDEYYKEKIEELENKCAVLQEKLNRETEHSTNQVLQLTKRIKQMEGVINYARQEDKDSENSKSSAPKELVHSPISVEEIKRESARVYLEKLKEMEKMYHLELVKIQSNLIIEIREIESKYRKAQEENEEKSNMRLAALQETIKTKVEEVDVLKKALTESSKKSEANDRIWQNKVDNLMKEIESLRESLEQQKKEKEEICKKNNSFESVENGFQQKEKELENMRCEISVLIKNWKKELESLKDRNEELESKYKEYSAKYEKAKKILSKCKSVIDEKEKFYNEREKYWKTKCEEIKEKGEKMIVSIKNEMLENTKKKVEAFIPKLTDLENENLKLKALLENSEK